MFLLMLIFQFQLDLTCQRFHKRRINKKYWIDFLELLQILWRSIH